MTDEGERLGGGVAGNDVPRVYGTVGWTLDGVDRTRCRDDLTNSPVDQPVEKLRARQ
jgi:hypothetical protein